MTMPSTITTNRDAAIAQPTPVSPMIVFPDRSDVPSAASELSMCSAWMIGTIALKGRAPRVPLMRTPI